MLSSYAYVVNPGPSGVIRRLHVSNLPESGDFVSFRYEVVSDPGGAAPHPPDTRDGTHAPLYP
jgi:hypothetical protein